MEKPDREIVVRRDLRVLEAVAENQRITQRGLANQLGIALGLANLYLKRLVRKGYIKCINVRPNRIRYLLTPKGVSEKARLTCEYMEHSLSLYRGVRQYLSIVLQPYVEAGPKAIALYGVGEAAELAYLSLKELGLEPAAIFSDEGDREFLGMPVQDVRQHTRVDFDLMLVATLEHAEPLLEKLINHGIPEVKLLPLRR
ncbi:MAG TPA: winged helix-turn-helix transcriptional regulator [Vicinamibacterales bacterium]|jgi:DNA-binding MarR family transcriptional regulator|nr:winged helix-turn-helix transcriptional regulator [Vicinamibacterales bacterium]|tara:strand:- start:731 stop:1327 length:597 start_codon:yes stop_codon:yes gene_type:complete